MFQLLEIVKRLWWVEDILLRPWFLKISIFLLAIFILGIPQYFVNEIKIEQVSRLPIQQEVQARRAYTEYADNLILAAKNRVKQGGDYSVKNYFADLKLVDLKLKELKAEYINDFRITAELQNLSRQSKTKFNELEITNMARDYRESLIDLRTNREATEKKLKALSIADISLLLWGIYISLLLPALFWMAVDCYKLHEESSWEKENRFLFPSPVRFLLMWLLYPFTFGIILCKWLKNNKQRYLAEAELRRTKQNLFGSLSEVELQRLKDFRKNNLSLSVWRQQLRQLGLKPQHCFAAALAVTVFLSVLPSISKAETKVKNLLPETAWEQVVDQGQHLARMRISDDEQSQNNAGQQDKADIFVEFFNLKIFFVEKLIEIQKSLLMLKEVYFHIDHVPLFGYSV